MLAVYAAPARRIATATLLLLALGWAAPAGAVPIAVDGGWTIFTWTGGLGSIDIPADGYQLTSLTSVQIQITDSATIGDEFELFVDSVSELNTSAIDPLLDGVPSGAFTGPAAWADSRLSKGSIVLAPGTYQIDVDVTRLSANILGGGQNQSGGGFIQVLSIVPEPSVLGLLALGLAGLMWVTTPRPQLKARPSSAKR